jgi:hypothetical protein
VEADSSDCLQVADAVWEVPTGVTHSCSCSLGELQEFACKDIILGLNHICTKEGTHGAAAAASDGGSMEVEEASGTLLDSS